MTPDEVPPPVMVGPNIVIHTVEKGKHVPGYIDESKDISKGSRFVEGYVEPDKIIPRVYPVCFKCVHWDKDRKQPYCNRLVSKGSIIMGVYHERLHDACSTERVDREGADRCGRAGKYFKPKLSRMERFALWLRRR